ERGPGHGSEILVVRGDPLRVALDRVAEEPELDGFERVPLAERHPRVVVEDRLGARGVRFGTAGGQEREEREADHQNATPIANETSAEKRSCVSEMGARMGRENIIRGETNSPLRT